MKKGLELLVNGYERMNEVLSSFKEDNIQLLDLLNNTEVNSKYQQVFNSSFDEISIVSECEEIAEESGINLNRKKSCEYTDIAFAELVKGLDDISKGIKLLSKEDNVLDKLKDASVFECSGEELVKKMNSFRLAYLKEIKKLVGSIQYEKVMKKVKEIR